MNTDIEKDTGGTLTIAAILAIVFIALLLICYYVLPKGKKIFDGSTLEYDVVEEELSEYEEPYIYDVVYNLEESETAAHKPVAIYYFESNDNYYSVIYIWDGNWKQVNVIKNNQEN